MGTFLKNNWKLVVIAVLSLLLVGTIKVAKDNHVRYLREKNNVESLTTELTHEKTKRGEDVTTIKDLQFTVKEFKERCAADAELIKELKIKASEVKEVVKTVVETKIEYRDSLVQVAPQQFVWNKDTEWWKVHQVIDFTGQPPMIDFNLSTKDSLSHVLYKVPKFKFLWWHFGTKGYEIKVISHAPNSTVLYNRWINVSKKKEERKRD